MTVKVKLNEQQKARYLAACSAPPNAVVTMLLKKTVAEVEVVEGFCLYAKWHVNLRTRKARRIV